MSKITIVRDSSQIDAFMMCPQYWKYRYDERLIPVGCDLSKGQALMMGTFGHSILESYYRLIAFGHSQSDSIESACALDPDKSHCECGHRTSDHDYKDNCTKCPCTSWTPKAFALGLTDRETVKQRCREYFYSHLSNDIVPESPDHVEVGFSELLYEDCERIYILEGRIDLIGTLSGLKTVMDHKFQLREKSLYKKSIQFRNYAMVTHSPLLILNMIRLAKGVTNKTFERPIASFTEFEHQRWRERLISIYHNMYEAILYKQWNKNESACSGRYGYQCDYTSLCEELNTDLIQPLKDTRYKIGEEWKPW